MGTINARQKVKATVSVNQRSAEQSWPRPLNREKRRDNPTGSSYVCPADAGTELVFTENAHGAFLGPTALSAQTFTSNVATSQDKTSSVARSESSELCWLGNGGAQHAAASRPEALPTSLCLHSSAMSYR
jgi:hypothetical protein